MRECRDYDSESRLKLSQCSTIRQRANQGFEAAAEAHAGNRSERNSALPNSLVRYRAVNKLGAIDWM